jgi:CHAT domain-containing protein
VLILTGVALALTARGLNAAAPPGPPPPARPPATEDLLKSGEERLQRADLFAAEDAFNAALRLARESRDRAAEARAGRGLTVTMAGSPEGLANARLALALHRGLQDAAGEAADLVALSAWYRAGGQGLKARQPLVDALAIERRLGLHAEEAQTLEQLASVERFEGAYEEALFDFEAAFELTRRNGISPAADVRLAVQLGELNADLGRYEDAERYLKTVPENARRLRAHTPPEAWAPVHEVMNKVLQRAGLDEIKASMGSAARPQEESDPSTAAAAPEPADPEFLRALIEAMAEADETESGQWLAADRALASLSMTSGASVVASPEFRTLWQHWVDAVRPRASDGYGVAALMLINYAGAFNQAALGHWHLKTLPDGWYVEQARQITVMLTAIDGHHHEVTAQQIVSRGQESPFYPLLGVPGATQWAAGLVAEQAGRQRAEALADTARSLRKVLASGTIDEETANMVASSAEGRRRMLHGSAGQFLGALSRALPPSPKDAMSSFGCELSALATLGRIYQALGYREEARSKNDEAWGVLAQSPTYAPFPRYELARKLKMAVPGQALAACGAVYHPESSILWDNDLQAAQGHAEEAIRGFELAAAKVPAVRPAAWARIAVLYADQGAKDHALAYYRKAIEATEAIQGQLRLGELVASWASHGEPLYAQAIRVLYDLKRPAEAFEYAERARARAFLNQIGNRRLPATGVPPELAKAVEDVRQRLIELENQSAANGSERTRLMGLGASAKPAHEMEDTRKLYEELLARVKRANPEYSSLVTVDTASLAQVQKEILDDRTSLVEYFVLDDETLVWIIDRGHVTWLALPVSASDLHHRIGYLRDLIARRRPSAEAAAALHSAVFAPLEPYLRHRRVVIVPHGALHFLPFGALWSAGRGRYVAQDYTLTLAPSASVLRFVLRKRKAATAGLLALGNPDGSLPHAEQEVRVVAQLYGSTPLLGRDAKESRLYQKGGAAGIVHLAAHATFDPVRPLFTRLDLAADGGISPPDERTDGKLHVYEIYGLDLENTNLIVLSACDTALGPRDAGDDIVGLPRAFLYAGAPAVLTTLWAVDDEATAAFMQAFYRRLRRGMVAAEALAGAQRDLLRQTTWREPYFWAAFTLTGAWNAERPSTGGR